MKNNFESFPAATKYKRPLRFVLQALKLLKEAGADTFRLGDRECLCIRVVRPAREACISGKKRREDKLRRTALRRKRHHRNIGEVIQDVLTVDGDDAV